jgi:hypothetical protein
MLSAFMLYILRFFATSKHLTEEGISRLLLDKNKFLYFPYEPLSREWIAHHTLAACAISMSSSG